MTKENKLKPNLISFSTKERYNFIIEKMPAAVKIVSSKYIAEFCGTSPKWLSKIKKKR